MKSCSRGLGFIAGIAIVSLSALLGTEVHASAPRGQYQTADDTVVDLKTRLSWQRGATSPKTLTDNSVSVTQYCQGLNLGGFSNGWRVPTRKELETLVDTSGEPWNAATIDTSAFPNTAKSWFCTSTPVVGTNASWAVDFALGGSCKAFPPNDKCWVRCVHSVE